MGGNIITGNTLAMLDYFFFLVILEPWESLCWVYTELGLKRCRTIGQMAATGVLAPVALTCTLAYGSRALVLAIQTWPDLVQRSGLKLKSGPTFDWLIAYNAWLSSMTWSACCI